MRIIDWSSDVCSSVLRRLAAHREPVSRVHPLDLASYQAIGHLTEPRPAIGFGDGRAEKPQGPKFQHDLAIKALVEIGACHARQKLVLRIVASRVAAHSLLLRDRKSVV